MEGYDPMGMPFMANSLSLNNSVSTDDYLNTLPTLGLAQQSLQAPNYDTNSFRG